nr:immunoglobulin heavy chain junction region [Macaca mulatta]MPN84346.1 immunoglobulin heavy chain junction region [Macaca mulatta]MPN84488.1 immunoglobulin heavy chain junction region [Macaca mulatta]MPN84592.1 immunoglobulin heavy chain junction region [Macaca mulatta]MPN84643.1 immunoglobulin heavy chain junction region [Macaca mulatta]
CARGDQSGYYTGNDYW